jgi:serine/threonine protein kinase/tetratricopeptide (TPR) repeat protein
MNALRWQRVRDLFLAVCDLDPAEQQTLLAHTCGTDDAVRAEVERLLESSEKPCTVLDRAAAALSGVVCPGESMIGRRVGAYRLVELIASGGMGTVFRAERADDQYRKHVAVKLMRLVLPDKENLRRFHAEKQTLAMLDHPNIARLLDAGVTSEAIPYLVMEYVEGQPIDAYCDERRLSIEQRLKLLQKVCHAVEYAHRQLVIHLDLKPGNILVTSDGTAKLLDFGIAKLVPATTEEAEPFTSQRPMTPDYASPEQIRGEPVSMASDVYSLGVILYQLLTGHHAYRIKTATPAEVERTVLKTEPMVPSSVVWRTEEVLSDNGDVTSRITPEAVSKTREGTPNRLSRRLRGDLDNIVMMALRKEPDRRYPSVARLAEDVDRHLKGLPVIARPDSFSYRAGKFIRRHRFGVAATLLIVACAGTASVGIARQASVAAAQRDEALQARAQAEAVVTFLEDMLTSVKPNAEGSSVTVREVLDQAARRMATELDADPAVKASLFATIGRSYLALGLYDQAEPNLRKALAIRQSAFGDRHPDVVESLRNLGSLKFATGDLDEAEALHRDALTTALSLFDREHPRTLQIKTDLAEVLSEHHDYAEAERLYRDVLTAQRNAPEATDRDVAVTLDRLADLAMRQGDYAEAVRSMEEALRIRRKIVTEGHPLVIESLIGLAVALHAQGEQERARELFAQAEPHVRRALEMHRGVLGNDHIMTLVLINNLGELLYGMGRLDEAEQMFREVVATSEAVITSGPQNPERVLNNLASVKSNLARVLMDRGDLEEADNLLHDALARRREVLGEIHLDVAELLDLLADIAKQRGDWAKTADLLEQVLRIRTMLQGDQHPASVETSVKLAEARERQSKLAGPFPSTSP